MRSCAEGKKKPARSLSARAGRLFLAPLPHVPLDAPLHGNDGTAAGQSAGRGRYPAVARQPRASRVMADKPADYRWADRSRSRLDGAVRHASETGSKQQQYDGRSCESALSLSLSLACLVATVARLELLSTDGRRCRSSRVQMVTVLHHARSFPRLFEATISPTTERPTSTTTTMPLKSTDRLTARPIALPTARSLRWLDGVPFRGRWPPAAGRGRAFRSDFRLAK
jgi:hypothetical protein